MMRLSLLLASLFAASSIAVAEPRLAFDFDTDGDASTIESVVEGNVGDLVEAFLVVRETPFGLGLRGVQFGLELTDGVEVVGAYPLPTGSMIREGVDGIAIAYVWHPASEMPLFVCRFIVRLTAATPQEIRVRPSTGWNNPLSGFLWALGNPVWEYEDEAAIAGQIPGTMLVGDALPSETVSWSRVKRLYQ